jgi:hypothetical protein
MRLSCSEVRREKKGNQPNARGASQLPNKQTLDDETLPIGSAAGLRLANGRALLKIQVWYSKNFTLLVLP